METRQGFETVTGRARLVSACPESFAAICRLFGRESVYGVSPNHDVGVVTPTSWSKWQAEKACLKEARVRPCTIITPTNSLLLIAYYS